MLQTIKGSAEELFQQAFEALKNNQLDKAEHIYQTLLENDPSSPVLVAYLGALHMKKGLNERAAIYLREAIRRYPDLIDAWVNLGCAYKHQQKIVEAREAFRKAVELTHADPEKTATDRSLVLCNLGSTYVGTGTPSDGIPLLKQAIELSPGNEEAHWNLGLAYLELGDYEQGFSEYEYGKRQLTAKHRKYHTDGTPIWNGTPGQTVVVYGEQGIGDEIMFASLLPDIMKDCNVILDGHIRLMDLFRHSFPGLPVYGTREGADVPWANFHNIDSHISIGSLAKFYRKKLEDFPGTPYLKADPELFEKYRKKLAALGTRPKIGLSWKGGTAATNMNARKIKLNQLLPLFDIDADFISLQYHPDSEEYVKNFNEKYGKNLIHWSDTLADYDETAGLVRNIDLIISVPQSVVHLAGALGVDTLQLCPRRALWQMGPYGEEMPWYSCVKNIWQDETETWEPVINQAKEAACRILQSNTEI